MANTTQTQEPQLLFGVPDVAVVLGIGRTRVFALIKSGELHSVKIGGRRLVPRSSLEDFVARLSKS